MPIMPKRSGVPCGENVPPFDERPIRMPKPPQDCRGCYGCTGSCTISFGSILLPFYQFTQPSVAVSLFSGNLLDLCDSFSVQLLRGQGPQNATHGDQDSSPGGPPNAPAGDPTGPSPAVRRPPRSLSTATRSIGPD